MKDPDQTEPTPEDIANEQAKAKQDAFNAQMADAELQGKNADVIKKQAEAFRAMILADREKAQTVLTNVESTAGAMMAAQSVIAMPTIARVADGILKEAGWVSGARPPMALPQMQNMQPPPQLPPPQSPPMVGAPPEQNRPPQIAMPPQQSLGQNTVPATIAGTQALTQSVEAMKTISDGTVSALTEVTQAIAVMAEQMKESSRTKSSKVVIQKQSDGSFVGTKTE